MAHGTPDARTGASSLGFDIKSGVGLPANSLFKRLKSSLHSNTLRRSANNFSYSLADYLTFPVLMIAATPFLTKRLGLEWYGIWMLANSILGTMVIFNMGLGDATIKYVSSYRGKMDPAGVKRVVRSTLTLNGLLGGVAALGIVFTARLLVHSIFKIEPKDQLLAVGAIKVAGVGLMLRSIDSVFFSTLRGYERYDLTARVTILVKVATVSYSVALAALGYGVLEILVGIVALTFCGTVAQAIMCCRLIPGMSFWPTLDPPAIREIAGFGAFGWLQGIGAMLFNQADRFLIAAMCGTASLGAYTVCLQLSQQVQALPGAAFSFLFPLISHQSERGEKSALRQLFKPSVYANVLFAACLASPLIFWSRRILTIWMGASFATSYSGLLVFLSVAFLLMSFNTATYYALMGLGRIQYVTWCTVAGSAAAFCAAAVTIHILGAPGGALGRMVYACITGVIMTRKLISVLGGISNTPLEVNTTLANQPVR